MEAMNHAWKYANRYGYPDGNVIQEIAAHHGVKPENVLLTPGSGEVLEIVGEAFLMGNTKKVVGADPTYATVYQHATQIKAEGIKVPLLKNYQQDLDTMISEANKNASTVGLFYLCNPNNPTGMVISAADVKKVVEGIPKTMPILIDEAYHHFVDDPAYGTSIPYVIEGRPVILVHNGHIREDAMRRSKLTMHELNAALRAEGHADVSTVFCAVLENNGHISVVARNNHQPPQ